MRTLAQIREDNKINDMFFTGMEKTPVHISDSLRKVEKSIYDNFVKPTSRRVYSRHFKSSEVSNDKNK